MSDAAHTELLLGVLEKYQQIIPALRNVEALAAMEISKVYAMAESAIETVKGNQ